MRAHQKLKQIRKENGDTLKDLAEKINYDYSNLSKVERGVYNPSIHLLTKISDIYNVNMSYFFDDNAKQNCLETEKQFIDDLSLEPLDLLQKYDLTVDDRPISPQELELLVTVIRKLRETMEENQSK